MKLKQNDLIFVIKKNILGEVIMKNNLNANLTSQMNLSSLH